MNNKITKTIVALSFFFSAFANADYQIKIPLEISNGGHLPNQSIVISQQQITPSEPEMPHPRQSLFTKKFEGMMYSAKKITADTKSVYYSDYGVFIIDTVLENGATYYLNTEPNECQFVATVCTMNVARDQGGCFMTDKNLSGVKTYLIRQGTSKPGTVCFNNNAFTLNVYDKTK